ncbi:ABC transporter substrate-binding protein [Lacibacterium aquatile]|uniref:Probable sugar-binding periplasmic protein n=1 Tax=Lacibacterium aquatile TaxID=1168082 RepID=A0ABW5DSK7_9PROT
MGINYSRLLACAMFGIAASTSAMAQDKQAEVIHWWTSAGEAAAVKVFADKFNAAGGKWVDSAIAGGSNARAAGINRIVGGKPPTAMQFNTGKQFDELIANDMLNTVDEVAKEDNWAKIVPTAFQNAVTRDGKIYAIPVNIHGQNWTWSSTAALEKAGVKEPKNWDEFLAAAEKLKAAGIIPLALGGQKWQERLLFNAVLTGVGGAPAYQQVYAKRDVSGEAFAKAAEIYGKLRQYVDPGSPGRNWNDTMAMIITGKAGFQFMGDWAKGELAAANLTPGKEVGCFILGEKPVFVMGGDMIVLAKTKDANQIAAQKLLAKTLMTPDAQVEFNVKKGSLPIRTDIDVSKMDACAQKGVAYMKDPANQQPNVDMLVTSDTLGTLDDVITAYWNTPGQKADEFTKKFAAALKASN